MPKWPQLDLGILFYLCIFYLHIFMLSLTLGELLPGSPAVTQGNKSTDPPTRTVSRKLMKSVSPKPANVSA